MERTPNSGLSLGPVGLELFGSFLGTGRVTLREINWQHESRAARDVAELTRQMVKGDEEAYREFHHAYFGRLLGYLLVVTRDEQLAREALQMTLLRVARYIKRFDSDEAFWGWLTVLARSAAADENRRSRRYTSLLDRFFAQTSADPARTTDEAYSRLRQVLEENLAALPPEERELIERKYFAGNSVREIAKTAGVTDKAIESRLVRIRQKLRQMVVLHLKHEK